MTISGGEACAYNAAMTISEAASCGHAEYLEAAEAVLATVLPADQTHFHDVDCLRRQVRLSGSPDPAPWLPAALLARVHEHPAAARYLGADASSSSDPRRISDLMPQHTFEQTATFAELFAPLDVRYQLTIMTARPGPRHGRWWAMNRGTVDFTDQELQAARAVQRALVVLDAVHSHVLAREADQSAGQSEQTALLAPQADRLTPREREVLDMLAAGYTAQHIAHALRITISTVRKHLQNIYDKLDSHDRLVVVQRARAMGLTRAGPATDSADP